MRSKPQSRNEPRVAGAAVLQEDVTRAITRAALQELASQGFGRLSMENVARRAGVGKAALYRRWSTKEAMIVALLADLGLEVASSPDTGSLDGDVAHYLREAIAILSRPLISRIAPHLYAEMVTNSGLAKLIRSTIQPAKRERAEEIIERAIARKELPADTNRDLALDVLTGPLYWRMIVMKERIDESYTLALIRFTLAGLRALSERTRA